MIMNQETKFFIGIILVTVLILTGAVIFFSQPEKPVSNDLLIKTDSWASGSATAKVTLVEFSDFECAACINVYPLIKNILQKYQNDLKFVYRHFPLEQHSESKQAAIAAEAAGVQGKFWEMHDALFDLKGQLGSDNIQKLVKDLKLDENKFNADFKSPDLNEKIQTDINDAISLRINSTPTFYLNGMKLKLSSFTDLDNEIQKILGK